MTGHDDRYSGTVTVASEDDGTRTAEAVLAARFDVWGNTRVVVVDRPPFPVELLDGADR